MQDASRRVPRILVKSFFHVLAEAQQLSLEPEGFTAGFIDRVLDKIFATKKEVESE